MKHFVVVVNYRGFNRERDKRILRTLERRDRRHFSGSGFSFFDGTRDLSFNTSKEEIAKRLQANLRKTLNKLRIRGSVTLHSGQD